MHLPIVTFLLLLLITPILSRARAIEPATKSPQPPPWYTLSPEEAMMDDIKDINALFPDEERPLHTTVLMGLTRETAAARAGTDREGEMRVELRRKN